MSQIDAPAEAPSERVSQDPAPDPFRPTWLRAVGATALAVGAFFIPQEIPLEYYPLNNPSSGLQYLEFTTAADVEGEVQIFMARGQGVSNFDSIQFPIGPSDRAYTYTFPLRDAPLEEMRIDPPNGGAMRFTNFRIINRREEEIRRFSREAFQPIQQIEEVAPTPDGWVIRATPDSNDPFAHINIGYPLVPEGMNERNFKRCLLSWSYLALMLWIILLAVYFTFLRHRNWRVVAQCMAFLAFLALIFSAVGNRGLIRTSLWAASYQLPPYEPGLFLEMDVTLEQPTRAQLFWNVGRGINQNDSAWSEHQPHEGLQTVRFPLPRGEALRELRFDPSDAGGTMTIKRIRVVDGRQFTVLQLPPSSLQAHNQIENITREDDTAVIEMQPDAGDPILLFDGDALEAINGAALDGSQWPVDGNR